MDEAQHTFDHARDAAIYVRDQFGYDEIRPDFQHESWSARDNDTALVVRIGA
jgi:hypothetical protein